MKDISLWLLLSFLCTNLLSQVPFYTDPLFPTADDDITIYFDATAIENNTIDTSANIYIHTGVITDECRHSKDWKYIVTNGKKAESNRLMEAMDNGLYQLAFNIRDYYDIPMAENMLHLAFEFWAKDESLISANNFGSNFQVPIYKTNTSLITRFLSPVHDLNPSLGESIEIFAVASQETELTLYDNGELIASNFGTQLTHTINAGPGNHLLAIVANSDYEKEMSYFTYHVPNENRVNLTKESDYQSNLTSSTNKNVMSASAENELTFNMTPNPSDGDLSIYYQTNTNIPIELNIIDVTGKQMYNEFITSFAGIHAKSLEMDLESGIYLVQLKMENKIITKKLIINHE